MEDKFVKADLHIHTPSSKCYKGAKNDNEYLKILQKAKDEDIKIIAITDHNTIEGYRKLIEIKSSLLTTRNSLIKITDSNQAAKELKITEDKLIFFENILILPGVEFEANPGVHILIIFNPTVSNDEINDFLKQGGYDKDNSGLETPTIISKWDILDLFAEASKYDTLIIDAHTDSNKGILNTTQKGTYRANCFSSSYLKAVCYKNVKQKDLLQTTILNADEYKRSTPLAFVQFSDSHNVDELGKHFTWIKIGSLSYNSVKAAFLNPDENISVEFPSTKKILDNLLKKDNSFGINDLTDNNLAIAQKYIAGLNNSDGGYILFGISEIKSKIGLHINDSKKDINDYVEKIISCFSSLEHMNDLKINIYQLLNDSIVISLFINKSNYLMGIKENNLVYSIINNKLATLSPKQIQSLIEDRRTQQIELKIKERIKVIESESQKINNYFDLLPLLRSFEEKSFPLYPLIKVAPLLPNKLKSIESEKLEKTEYNGKSRGNITFFVKDIEPRLGDAYLRYSLPLFNLKSSTKTPVVQETVYMVPGSATFYAKKEYPFFSENNFPILKIASRDTKYLSNKIICTYLKSSINLWYCLNLLGDINLMKAEIFQEIRIPYINSTLHKPFIEKISSLFDKIIEAENNVLIQISSVHDKEKADIIINHNSLIDNYAYEIDRMFYSILGLTDVQVEVIENNLRSANIYLPSVKK